MLHHPGLELVALGSDSQAGQPATALDPRLSGTARCRRSSRTPRRPRAAPTSSSGASRTSAPRRWIRPADGVVVDLSGAHRIRDTSLYPQWYGFEHPKPEGQADWCYALTELQPPTGRLIANPGCYATAAILALAPLRDVVDPASVVVDAKSGVSGAGRVAERDDARGLGAREPQAVLDRPPPARARAELMLGFAPAFVPHLLPIRRGLLATCYVDGVSADVARGAARSRLRESPVVQRAAGGRRAGDRARRAHRRRRARRLRRPAERPHDRDRAEDNLGKGAAGQAMQNANLALGLAETDGPAPHGVKV